MNLWLTNRCNLSCYFCPVVTHSGEPRTELNFEFIESFLDKASSIFPKLSVVTFSGGEPLIHSRFLKILEIVKLRGYDIELFTNGVFLQNLADVGVLRVFARIHVSLHSIDSYEEVFGTSNKKTKEHVLKCLRSLDKNMKERTFLSVAMTSINRVNEVLRFARSCGLKVNLFTIRNFKHAYDLTHEIREDPIDSQIQKTMKNNRDIISSPCQHTLGKLMALHTKNFSWSMPCTVPLESVTVDYQGNMRLCCGDQPPIGKAMDIPNILTNQVSRRILLEANRRLGVCRNCSLGVDSCFKCVTPRKIVGFAKKQIQSHLAGKIKGT